MHGGLGAVLALTLALAIPGAGMADNWVRDAAGRCEREWTPGSLARGPTAVANGLMLPFRSLAGSLMMPQALIWSHRPIIMGMRALLSSGLSGTSLS